MQRRDFLRYSALGRPFIWNPIVQKCMHDEEASRLLHYTYRPGYEKLLEV